MHFSMSCWIGPRTTSIMGPDFMEYLLHFPASSWFRDKLWMIPWPILVCSTTLIAVSWRGSINASVGTWKYGSRVRRHIWLSPELVAWQGSLHCFWVCNLHLQLQFHARFWLAGFWLLQTICNLFERQQFHISVSHRRSTRFLTWLATVSWYLWTFYSGPTVNWLLSSCGQFFLESWDHCCCLDLP